METGSNDPLTAEARQLREQVEALTMAVRVSARGLNVLRFITGGLVVLLIAVILLGAGYYQTAQAQHRTTAEVLCPLYKTFLGLYHPELQPPEVRPQYEETFKTLRNSYAVLECASAR